MELSIRTFSAFIDQLIDNSFVLILLQIDEYIVITIKGVQ